MCKISGKKSNILLDLCRTAFCCPATLLKVVPLKDISKLIVKVRCKEVGGRSVKTEVLCTLRNKLALKSVGFILDETCMRLPCIFLI